MSGNTWKLSGNLIFFFYISVNVIRPKCSRKYKVRSRIKFLPCFRRRNKTYVDGITRLLSGNRVFFLVSDDVFRPRVTRFRSGNTIFFLAPRYISIGLFQHSLSLIFLCHYRTGKYVVIVCFFLFFSPIPYLCPTMLNHTNIRAIFSS